MTEEWRTVPGFGGRYQVSDLGNVRSLLSDKVLAQFPGGWKNYLRVWMHFEGQRARKDVHRLVCMAFHGDQPDANYEVRHLDGDPKNNRADNLAWGSRADQRWDDIRNGVHVNSRKTHCPRGHEYDGWHPKAGRYCNTCRRAISAEKRRASA